MSETSKRIEILMPPEADIPPRFKRGATFSIELSGAGFGDTYKGDVIVLSRYKLRSGNIMMKLETIPTSADTGTGSDEIHS